MADLGPSPDAERTEEAGDLDDVSTPPSAEPRRLHRSVAAEGHAVLIAIA